MEAGEENIANAIRSGGDGRTGDQMGYVMTADVYSVSNDAAPVVGRGVGGALKIGTGLGLPSAPARGRAGFRRAPTYPTRSRERLQGLPDCWTLTQADGTEQSDSARYRQLGNSVAVPCVTWITRRIAAVEHLASEAAA